MNSCLVTSKPLCTFLALCLVLLTMPVTAATWNPDRKIDLPELTLQLMSRSSEQMQAFYEARGFPVGMLKEIEAVCFFTIGVNNNTSDTLWMDLSRWQAHDQHGKPLVIRNRSQWRQRWKQLGLPLSNISTFSWTVMPDARDLYPQERIGSNVTIERTARSMGPITLTARFPRGKDRQGGEVAVKLEKLKCHD